MYECRCCRHITLGEPGGYNICSVCYWEDEPGLELDEISGPNHMTLIEGRENYKKIGACEESVKRWCRPPTDEELSP